MNKPPKDLWKDEFREWLNSRMVQMAIKALVPEGRNDDLMAVLEDAFEKGFEHGVTGTLGALVRATKQNGESVKVNGIPQPGVGHA